MTTAAPRSLTVVVAGDILTHLPVVRAACPPRQPCDFGALLAPTRSVVEIADLAICHLEVPIAPPGQKVTGYPTFGAPAALATGIASVGWDRCSTASNHSLDRGIRGIDATLNALDAAGVQHSGTARALNQTRPRLIDVSGVRVGHLSYSYGFNGLRLPQGNHWRANLINVERIIADAAAARTDGAELVLVSLHWGQEYRTQPTGDQQRLAARLTTSGLVDLIIGHHAHVVQPIVSMNDRWVIYGLGNHLSAQRQPSRPATQDGAIVSVRFVEANPTSTTTGTNGATGPRFAAKRPVVHPTWVTPVRRRVLLVNETLSTVAPGDPLRASLAASRARTARVLGPFFPS